MCGAVGKSGSPISRWMIFPPGVLDGPGAGEHLEGGLGAEPGHAVCEPDTCHGLMIGL